MSETAIYIDGQLREYTIAEAERIGVQADAMAGRIEKATQLFEQSIAGLDVIAAQIARTMEQSRAALGEAKIHAQALRDERDTCFRIRDKLRADAAAGKPFEGVLVVQS